MTSRGVQNGPTPFMGTLEKIGDASASPWKRDKCRLGLDPSTSHCKDEVHMFSECLASIHKWQLAFSNLVLTIADKNLI